MPVGCAVDDFGRGYALSSYPDVCPVGELRIDGNFGGR